MSDMTKRTNGEIARYIMHVSETEDYSPPYRVLPEPPISCKWMDLKTERIKEALSAKDSQAEKELSELKAENELLKKDILKLPYQVLIPANLFISQEKEISELRKENERLQNLLRVEPQWQVENRRLQKELSELKIKLGEVREAFKNRYSNGECLNCGFPIFKCVPTCEWDIALTLLDEILK